MASTGDSKDKETSLHDGNLPIIRSIQQIRDKVSADALKTCLRHWAAEATVLQLIPMVELNKRTNPDNVKPFRCLFGAILISEVFTVLDISHDFRVGFVKSMKSSDPPTLGVWVVSTAIDRDVLKYIKNAAKEEVTDDSDIKLFTPKELITQIYVYQDTVISRIFDFEINDGGQYVSVDEKSMDKSSKLRKDVNKIKSILKQKEMYYPATKYKTIAEIGSIAKQKFEYYCRFLKQ